MNDRQTRKFNMGGVTLEGLNGNSSIWSANPTAVAKQAQLEADLDAIELADENQLQTSTGGEAVSKAEAKHDMASEGDIIANGVCAYALDNNNPTVFNGFHKSAVMIESMKDVDALAFCNLLYNYANNNIGVLGDYNIDAPMVTSFQGKITAFDDIDSEPVLAVGLHHAATLDVATGITNMFKTLNWWDLFAGTLRITQPDFHSSYQTWRKTLDTGVRHISIRGLVTDSVTSTPLYKAKITVTNLPAPKITFSGKTGKYRHFSLDPGVYTITAELAGYQTLTINNISVLEGKITTANISLVKI